MKKVIFVLLVSLLFCLSISAQATSTTQPTPAASVKKPKKPIFRANKAQTTEAQKMLKAKSMYSGEETGKLDTASRTSIKSFQKDNGLRATGTLNRATLEKMGIELTDKQKLIPVSANSYASAETKTTKPKTAAKTKTATTSEGKPKKVIFRATKDQIMEAQKMLKAKSMYDGEETGKLDDATRGGLKKFQEANGVKVTGTLNQVTLEKMGIALTDKQKADAAEMNK